MEDVVAVVAAVVDVAVIVITTAGEDEAVEATLVEMEDPAVEEVGVAVHQVVALVMDQELEPGTEMAKWTSNDFI